MEDNYFPASSVVSSDRILYTPSEFARSSLLHLQEIGRLQALQPHVSSRSKLASCLFFIVLSGSGTLTCSGREYTLKEGSCAFIDCSFPYSHATSREQLWTLRWCHFYGPALPAICGKYTERGGLPAFRPKDTGPFLEVLDRLYELAGGSDYIRDMKINEELGRLLTLLMQESWHPEEQTSPAEKRSVVSAVRNWLDTHYPEKITLDRLSREFFINKYYLTRAFKKQFGISIISYLQNVRITRAKHLLRFTDKSVEEIAAECGLGQLHYFSRLFREVEGIPPTTYRSRW